mgnify:CR=1 FL=1
MESIINDYVNTDFKELLLKFDYSNLNNNLFYKGSYYNLESNLSSPDKIKSPGSEASLNKESKDISNISNSISNVSLVSLVSQVSHVSQDSSDIPRCYPENYEIFRCFNYFNQCDLKYIILGQDPYHNGQANGLAFSINEGEKQPASLRIINKEYNRSMNTDTVLSDLSFLSHPSLYAFFIVSIISLFSYPALLYNSHANAWSSGRPWNISLYLKNSSSVIILFNL